MAGQGACILVVPRQMSLAAALCAAVPEACGEALGRRDGAFRTRLFRSTRRCSADALAGPDSKCMRLGRLLTGISGPEVRYADDPWASEGEAVPRGVDGGAGANGGRI